MSCRKPYVHTFRPREIVTNGIKRRWIEKDQTEGLVLEVASDHQFFMYETAILVIGQPINPEFSHLPVYIERVPSGDLNVSVRVDERWNDGAGWGGYGMQGGRHGNGEVGTDLNEITNIGDCEAVFPIVPACGEIPEAPRRRRHREFIPVDLRDGNRAFGRALAYWHCRPYGMCLRFTNSGRIVLN